MFQQAWRERLIGKFEVAAAETAVQLKNVFRDQRDRTQPVSFPRNVINMGDIAKLAAVEVTAFSEQNRQDGFGGEVALQWQVGKIGGCLLYTSRCV